jgi:hypothetical protein
MFSNLQSTLTRFSLSCGYSSLSNLSKIESNELLFSVVAISLFIQSTNFPTFVNNTNLLTAQSWSSADDTKPAIRQSLSLMKNPPPESPDEIFHSSIILLSVSLTFLTSARIFPQLTRTEGRLRAESRKVVILEEAVVVCESRDFNFLRSRLVTQWLF